jgi:hypothetical protein
LCVYYTRNKKLLAQAKISIVRTTYLFVYEFLGKLLFHMLLVISY